MVMSLLLKLAVPLDDITPKDSKEVVEAFKFSFIRKFFLNQLVKKI